MSDIKIPILPKFMFSVDHHREELYIISTSPIALIWVRPTFPEEFYIIEGEKDTEMLQRAIEWYKKNHQINMH